MGRIDDASKCLALALLNFADDEGYFLADSNLVRSACRPFDDDSTITRRCLDLLVKSEWIEIKIHPSHGAIGFICSFNVHQKIDRPKDSTIKAYFIDDDSTIDRRLIAVGKEGKGKEGKGTGKRRSRSEIVNGFSEEVKLVVNTLGPIWPMEGSEGAKTSAISPQDFCQRVSEILDEKYSHEDLILAGKNYIGSPRKRYAAPQFFFGKRGFDGGAPPWIAFVRDIITRREYASATT